MINTKKVITFISIAALTLSSSTIASVACEINKDVNLGLLEFPLPVSIEYQSGTLLPITPEVKNMENTYTDPVTGDVMTNSFDPTTLTSTVNVVAKRRNAPDVYTKSTPNEVYVKTTGDGDIFGGKPSLLNSGVSGNETTTIEIVLKNSSTMNYQINADNKAKKVTLVMDKTSKWVVEGDSYLTVLIDEDKSLSNIISNGYTICYDSSKEENSWLCQKTYILIGGGVLKPVK